MMPPFDVASIDKSVDFIAKLKKIKVEELSKDPLIRSKLSKIVLQASMPFCAEQVISVLVEILSLKHTYKINNLGGVKFDDSVNISILADSILHLLKREHDSELFSKFEKSIHDFTVSGGNEAVFFDEIRILHNKYISHIDIDFVMQTAAHTRKSKETTSKNAILVVGKTGSGKSFVINYLCCEGMFTRSFLGQKLTVHEDKQPPYLKHIKIGQSVMSETSKMGVVDVSKSTSPWMKKFSGNTYVICDTPGEGDNRGLSLGPELKLANSLETIVPVYKANSVRFLVLINAKATSARGKEFIDTITFVSKMFGSIADL